MTHTPIISIVLCTYNNADSLALTLEQLARQSNVPEHALEVILVNNNSPDQTAEVAQRSVETSPIPIRYFFEGRQGLSFARNTGVEQAAGQYILFTDDDAEIPPDWVSGYLAKIDALAPDCLYSKIEIIWDRPQPWWYSPRYRAYFVGLDYGDATFTVTDIHREFFGKNFCIRKELIAELGGFDPALGRSGNKLIAGEETLLYRRMVEQGRTIYYFPDSPVGHRLKEREYTEQNIRKQFIDSAHSAYHMAKLTARKRLFGRPLRLLLDNLQALGSSVVGTVVSALRRDRREFFFHRINTRRSLTLISLWLRSQ